MWMLAKERGAWIRPYFRENAVRSQSRWAAVEKCCSTSAGGLMDTSTKEDRAQVRVQQYQWRVYRSKQRFVSGVNIQDLGERGGKDSFVHVE